MWLLLTRLVESESKMTLEGGRGGDLSTLLSGSQSAVLYIVLGVS